MQLVNHGSISSCHKDLGSATLNRKVGAALAPGVHPEKCCARDACVPTTERLPNQWESLRWLWLPPFSHLALSGLGGESCRAQPKPSPSRVWPTRSPGVGRQPASPSWQALSSASAGDPPSRGLSGRPGGLSAPV